MRKLLFIILVSIVVTGLSSASVNAIELSKSALLSADSLSKAQI